MPRYLVLYRSSASVGDQMAAGTPEQMQEGMAMWMQWAEKAGKALVDFGSPTGNSQLVPSGAAAQTGTPIAGFSIVETDSAAALRDLLADHPHLHAPDAAIEVLEQLPPPGM